MDVDVHFPDVVPRTPDTMRLEELDFSLPPELIAQVPAARRDASRLLAVHRASGAITHHGFGEIPDLLRPGDLLVMNDAAVFPARLDLKRSTGGRYDALLLAPDPSDPLRWTALLNTHGKLRPGEVLTVERGDGAGLFLEGRRDGGTWTVRFQGVTDARALIDRAGRVPLPPYIHRGDDLSREREDRERYQTVYAREPVAAAAPTAGLHFTNEVLDQLAARGIQRAFVTLAVGPGTFRPVKSETVEEHPMHGERWTVPAETADAVRAARAEGRRIVAVGTTAVRTLEAAAAASPDGLPRAGSGETRLFILPGYRFLCVDALITNFHLPRSTLLALVMAMADPDLVRSAYAVAVKERYRFFSYGDGMFIA